MSDRNVKVTIDTQVNPTGIEQAKQALRSMKGEIPGGGMVGGSGGGAPGMGGAGAPTSAGSLPPAPTPPLPSQTPAGQAANFALRPQRESPQQERWQAWDRDYRHADMASQQASEQQQRYREVERAAREERDREREKARAAAQQQRDDQRRQQEEEKRRSEEERARSSTAMGAAQSAGGFISNAASTAAGIGLGNTIFGFLTGSAEQYAALSDVMTGLAAKFRDAEVAGASFGTSLGYMRAEAGALAERLGGQTDRLDISLARATMGFARFTGSDVGMVADVAGQSARLTGETPDLGRLRGQALSMGMGRGRLAEYMGAYSQAEQRMFETSGMVSQTAAQALVGLPGIFFGQSDERSRGAYGQRFTQNIQDMLAGGDEAMTLELMRSMGYGSKGGPSYIDAMIAIDEGVQGREGMGLLYKFASGLKNQGYTSDQLFTALSRTWKGSKRDLRTFTEGITSGATLEDIQRMSESPEATAQMYGVINESRMTDVERERYMEGGFAGAGSANVSAGQSFRVAREGLSMTTGPTALEFSMDMLQAVETIGKAANELVKWASGKDIATLIGELGDNIVKFAEATKQFADWVAKLPTPSQIMNDVMVPDNIRIDASGRPMGIFGAK